MENEMAGAERSWTGFRQTTMTRIFRTLLIWPLLLYACSPGSLSPEAPPPTLAADAPTEITTFVYTEEAPTADIIPTSTTEVLPPPKLIATLATPHIDQPPDGFSTLIPSNPQGCAYQWAYQDLPDLTREFQSGLRLLQSGAQGNAFAFGENCVYADGSATFIPMETDFNITLQVSDLSNESDLGEWMVKVVQMIENFPTDQIIGPRPGRVSIAFQSNGEQKFVNFYLDQYRALPEGLSSAEIYQALQMQQ